MTEQEKRKGGGARLSRSETVTVRLDPKLRYIAELAARRQRRTLSSFIEWAVEKALAEVTLKADGDWSLSLLEAAPKLWAIEAADRLLKLAEQFPELMSYEEEVVWNAIKTVSAYESWRDAEGKYQSRSAHFFRDGSANRENVKNCWKELTAYAAGNLAEDELKKALLVSDIPF